MRICLIASPESLHLKRWVEFFINQNHEVHLIYLKKLFGKSPEYSLPGCKIHRILFPTFFLLNAQSFIYIYQLKKLLKKINPDILHAHYISYHAWLAARTNFHPFIVSAWGSDIYSEAKNIKKNFKWASYVFDKADAITTTSSTLKEFIIKNYRFNKQKIKDFDWGQDLTIFYKGYQKEVQQIRKDFNLNKDTFIVFSNRNIKPIYKIKYIIESIPLVIEKEKNVRFIFLLGAFDPNYVDVIKTRIKELQIDDYVSFIPKLLPAKELAVFDNLADVVISIPDSDQFSGALREAMVCGAIPILHDLKIYRINLTDKVNCFFVDRENSKDIAKTIIYCIDNHPELKERIGNVNIKLIKEKFDWSKSSNLMLDLYEKLIVNNNNKK